MSELDEIRKRKLASFQRERKAPSEEEQLEAKVAQLEAQIKPLMSRDAMVRYGTIKAVSPERAIQALVVITQLLSKGAKEIDDNTLKTILHRLTPTKRETKINRI